MYIFFYLLVICVRRSIASDLLVSLLNAQKRFVARTNTQYVRRTEHVQCCDVIARLDVVPDLTYYLVCLKIITVFYLPERLSQ